MWDDFTIKFALKVAQAIENVCLYTLSRISRSLRTHYSFSISPTLFAALYIAITQTERPVNALSTGHVIKLTWIFNGGLFWHNTNSWKNIYFDRGAYRFPAPISLFALSRRRRLLESRSSGRYSIPSWWRKCHYINNWKKWNQFYTLLKLLTREDLISKPRYILFFFYQQR